MILKKLLIIIFCLFFLSPIYAKSWFVDNDAAGLNNGASWHNAWQSFSKIVWGISGVNYGDTLFISGGTSSKIYYETLAIGISGRLGNPITIKIGQQNQHNGAVIIDCLGSIDHCIALKNNVVIDGESSNSINFVCKNSVRDGIISQRNCQNVIIRYVEVQHCGGSKGFDGIELLRPQNCIIEYCFIHHNFQNGIKTTGSLGEWGSNIIRFNKIANNCDDGIIGRNGIDIYGNKIYLQGIPCSTGHPDGIQTMGNYIRIYANEIFDNFTQQIILSFDNSQAGHVRIYNNIIYQTTASKLKAKFARGVNIRSTRKCKTIEDVLIANNTFVDLNFPAILVKMNEATTISALKSISILNNIMTNCHVIGRSQKNGISVSNSGNYTSDSILIDYNLMDFGLKIKWRDQVFTSNQLMEIG